MSRRLLPLVALLTVVLVLPAGAADAAGSRAVDATAESGAFALVNQERAGQGLAALASNQELVQLARQHSEAMARDVESGGRCGDGSTLRHRNPLSGGVTAPWRMLRENVGCGYGSSGTDAVIHNGFMNSPGHRANILAGDVNQIGVGAFRDANGGLWITQIFMQADIAAAPAPTPSLAPTPETVRIAVRTSQATFGAGTASFAVVARADNFADSLGGAALAGSDAPILFTPSPSAGNPDPKLDGNTRAELDRVLGGSGTVYLLGGTAAVGPAVEHELKAAGYQVVRFAGADRYETATKVADEVVRRHGAPDTVVVAYGHNWPDAVTGGAAAARNGLPVVLTATDRIPAATASFLARHADAERVALGGTAVIADSVVRQLKARRLAGADRAATAVAIAEGLFGPTSGDVVVINGWDKDGWARAMALTARAARDAAPQLLVSSSVPAATAEYLQQHRGDVTFGDAVDSGTRASVQTLTS